MRILFRRGGATRKWTPTLISKAAWLRAYVYARLGALLWGSLASCGRLAIGRTQRVPPAFAPDSGGSQPPRRLPACPTSRQRFHFYAAHPSARLWEVRDFGRETHIRRGCPDRAVDDVRNLTVGADANRDQVVKLHVGVVRSFEGPGQHDAFVTEDAIDAKSPSLVTGHIGRHLVGGPAVGAGCARVARLVRRIVGDLALVEVDPPAGAVPDYLELLVMFDKQTVDGDVVPIHDQPVRTGIDFPAHALVHAVVRAPDPGVIHDRVAAIDPQVDRRAPRRGAAHPEENVMEGSRVAHVAGAASVRTDFEQHGGIGFSRVEQQPGQDHSVHTGHSHGRNAVICP